MEFTESMHPETTSTMFLYDTLTQPTGSNGNPLEGDWDDEEDEDFDDQLETENDLHEIRVDDDLGEPDPEEDDHLPDDDLNWLAKATIY